MENPIAPDGDWGGGLRRQHPRFEAPPSHEPTGTARKTRRTPKSPAKPKKLRERGSASGLEVHSEISAPDVRNSPQSRTPGDRGRGPGGALVPLPPRAKEHAPQDGIPRPNPRFEEAGGFPSARRLGASVTPRTPRGREHSFSVSGQTQSGLRPPLGSALRSGAMSPARGLGASCHASPARNAALSRTTPPRPIRPCGPPWARGSAPGLARCSRRLSASYS